MRLAILFFAAGIALLEVQASLPSSRILLGLIAIAALCGFFSRRLCASPRTYAHSTLLLLIAALSLGFCWASFRAEQRLANQLPESSENRDIRVTGVIAGLPQNLANGFRFAFDVETIETPDAVVPRKILLSWYRPRNAKPVNEDVSAAKSEEIPAQNFRPGERWRFTVRLKRPHGNANPHGFDYEAWLFEREIRATSNIRTTRSDAPPEMLAAFVPRFNYAIERLRDEIRQRFLAVLPEAPYVGVLIALAIGDQRAIPTEQWLTFNRTGITHLVSISGLHVTMIAALLAALVNFLWRKSETLCVYLPAQKAALLAGWLAATFYALLAGFEIPAQRTLYMLSVIALALWTGRNLGVSRVILAALFVVVLIDPWALLSTGFWLSFGAVAVLLFVGTSRIGRTKGWRAVLKEWGMAQWAVTIGSIPLLLFFFQQFSLVSPLANALAIPFVSFIVTPLSLLFALFPWPPLLYLDHALVSFLMCGLEWLADWPVWQQAAPPLFASIVALAGIVWLLLPRGFPGRSAGLFLILPALFWTPPRPVNGDAWVDILDVGQGLAVLVRTEKHNLLYDTGSTYSANPTGSNAGLRTVLPYLRALGIRSLDTLVVSHEDKDHSGGAASIQAALPIERTLSSITLFKGALCEAGQDWHWEGVNFTILYPSADDYAKNPKKTNSRSCVLRIDTGKVSLLLTGDIEAADERKLIERAPFLLKNNVVVVPHHGGAGSSTPAFISAVAPQEAIFSAGYKNPFNHPRPDTLARYASARTWRTDLQGAIHVRLEKVVEIAAWREERRRYWQ